MYARRGAPSRTGLGSLRERIGSSVDAAREYLRDRWDAFVALEPRILDMQHRAAQVAYHADQAGDIQSAELARDIIRTLGKLGERHVQAVDTMRDVSRWVGLSSYPGLGAIPFAQVSVITGLALTVLWFFRAFEAEERKLELIEAGTLTPEEAAALDAGPAPGSVFRDLGGLAKLALGGLALFTLARLAETATAWKSNPELVVWDTNPPAEPMGRRVWAVWYRHEEDGSDYVHEFGPGVRMYPEDDGTVRFRHRWGRPLWREF